MSSHRIRYSATAALHDVDAFGHENPYRARHKPELFPKARNGAGLLCRRPKGLSAAPRGAIVNNDSKKEARREIIRIPTAAHGIQSDLLSPIPAAQTSFRSGGTMYPWIDLLIGIFTWLGLFAFTGAMLAGVIG